MKYIFCIIFFVSLPLTYAYSQDKDPLSKAKFELIKKAVWFYSKDITAFTNHPSDCTNSKTYNELKDCAASMKGVAENIGVWEETKIGSVSDLKSLNEKITKAVIIKGYRENMPEFKIFKSQSKEIIASIETQHSGNDTSSSNLTTLNSDTLNQSENTAKEIEENIEKSDEVNLDDKNGKSDSGFNMWLIMAILLSVVVFVYSWISNKLLKKDLEDLQRQIKSRDSSSNGDMKLPQRISALEKEIKSFDESFETLKQEINKKIKALTVGNNPSSQQTQTSQTHTKSESNQLNTSVKYAKYADLGDGFSSSELLPASDDDTIFEIQITSNNTAKFRVIENSNAQRYALTNPSYFFAKTCEYDSVPSSNSKITTNTDGELKLQSGKWQISRSAKISFE